MILLAGFSDIDSASPALADTHRRASRRERGPRKKSSPPPDESCRRCGGLMVPSYTASLESDCTGKPMTLWRCVNCGDCVDACILANRWKGGGPARPHERPRTGRRYAGQPRGGGRGIRASATRRAVVESDYQGNQGS